MTVFWFLAGLFAGLNLGVAYSWLRWRRFDRTVVSRVDLYTRPDVLAHLRERLQTDPGKPW